MGADFASIFFHNSGFTVEVFADTLTENRQFRYPNRTNGVLATTDDVAEIAASAGAGSVTSVALTVPSSIFNVTGSPVTTTGTLAINLVSQAARSFFAVGATNGAPSFRAIAVDDLPNIPTSKITGNLPINFDSQSANTFLGVGGTPGSPTFRAITDADLPNIPTTKLTGVLQASQMPAGTNNSYFQIDSDGSGGRIAWDTSGSEFRLQNAAGTGYVNLRVSNLFVDGTTTTVSSETVTFADNILLLNSNASALSENAGLEVNRPTTDNSLFQWNETNDAFEAGVVGNVLELTRKSNGTFTNANLIGTSITIAHNLRERHPELIIKNGNGRIITFTYNPVDDNSLTIEMNRVTPISGTWEWYAKG